MFAIIRTVANLFNLDKKCARLMSGGIVLTFIFKLFESLPDVIMGLMVDVAIHKEHSFLSRYNIAGDPTTIYILSLLLLIVYILGSFFQFSSTICWKHAASAVQFRLRMRLSAFILSKTDIRTSAGQIDSLHSDFRMTNFEIDDVEFLVHKTMEDFFRLVFSTLIVGPILYVIAPGFLVYALIPIIPTFFISKSLKDRVRPGYNAVRKAMKRVFQEVDEALLGFGVIKDFAIEAKFFKKIEGAATFLDSESRRTSYLAASMVPATKILVQIGVLAILVHATILMRNGALSFGQFATVSFLSRKFLLPFSFLGGLTDMCGKGVNAYNNVTSAIRLPRDFQFRSAIEVYPAIETIRIDALTFSYDQRPIFANLNVEFKPGRLNVIKGVTGAGKSTLFRLILGDLKPSAGHVYIGSTEADVYSQSSRQNIALVTQFPKLFTASLRENITLFATEVDDERLRRALSVSLIETLVQELPDGLDTVIGPSGLQLSGGQMQSVAIARALYSRANVLLLDEPTASFDVQREKDFLLRLKQNLGNRILIVTSHRAQPIEFADSVLTL